MSSFKIKIDAKRIEKELNKQVEKIVFDKQKEIIKKKLIKGDSEMNILPNKEEILLEIILNKYDGNESMIVNGSYDEIPSNMHFEIKNIFRTLELYNYIGHFEQWLNGWSVVLNQEGIEYFEREEKYFKRMKESANNTYNVGNIYADGSNVVIGDVINSSLNIDNSYTRIENRIEQECDQEDKLEIKELLEEVKEIIDNMKKNGSIGQRKSFFKRLTDHACKYGWLYAEIVNLIGNAAIGIIGGK